MPIPAAVNQVKTRLADAEAVVDRLKKEERFTEAVTAKTVRDSCNQVEIRGSKSGSSCIAKNAMMEPSND